jgi:hypothetical protein
MNSNHIKTLTDSYERDRMMYFNENAEDLLLLKRFDTILDLYSYLLYDLYLVPEESSAVWLCKVKERESVVETLDYNICVPINKHYGYIDIYYVYDRQGGLLITEAAVSEE